MSRIGKKLIAIPAGVEVKREGTTVTVKGPLGTLTRTFIDDISMEVTAENVTVTPRKTTQFLKALWGTYASHLENMIEGVTKGFEKKLLIEGVGYKYAVAGTTVNLEIGLSHSVKVEIPQGLKVVVEKNLMTITGIDKDAVGGFAAKIRALKRGEPYKGKGIRYINEVLRRKQGKKSTA